MSNLQAETQNLNTPDSSNKTTELEPTALLSLESQTITHACPTHGDVSIYRARLVGSDWGPIRCPECEAAREQDRQTALAQQRLREDRLARERRVQTSFNQAAIPPRFTGREFSSYQPENEAARNILGIFQDYATNFPQYKRAGQGMILCGNAGTGKTHLACAVASHVIREHLAIAVYTTAGKAFRAIKDTYRRDSAQTEQQALNTFALPDLLILDEVGIQYGSNTELNILFDIINERYERLLPTILISNLALPKLSEYAGDRVIDRMKENGGRLIVFDWQSHRGTA